jgi:hypothetical protein
MAAHQTTKGQNAHAMARKSPTTIGQRAALLPRGFKFMEIAAQKVYKMKNKVEGRPQCKSRTPVSRDHGN